MREHLGIPLPVVGCLRTSERIAQSIVARQPLIVRRGIDDNVRAFHHMAEIVMNDEGAADARLPAGRRPIEVVAAAPLPADIGRYARKHTRYPVDWAATLELAVGRHRGARPRRLRERRGRRDGDAAARRRHGRACTSTSCAAIPRAAVVVKNVVPTSNRVGLGFADKGRIPPRLVAAARAAAARPSS